MSNLLVVCLSVMLVFLPESYQESRAIPLENRVLGGISGIAATLDVYRSSLASIRYSTLQYQIHICGGFIINKHWIGTAAQCLVDQSTQNTVVAVGTATVTGGSIYNINQIEMHQNYNELTLAHDIGLLRTATPITFNANTVRPANLYKNVFPENKTVYIFGWGRTSAGSSLSTNVLYQGTDTMTTEQCKAQFPFVARRFISDRQICTVKSNVAACQGDAGVPLLIVENGDPVAVGIVSWVEPCVAGQTNVHTRISSYVNWIAGFTRTDD